MINQALNSWINKFFIEPFTQQLLLPEIEKEKLNIELYALFTAKTPEVLLIAQKNIRFRLDQLVETQFVFDFQDS
jgi:hypothetical protein